MAPSGTLSVCIRELQENGAWIPAQPAPPQAIDELRKSGFLQDFDSRDHVLEHPRVFFPSHPYEWTPGMLARAGLHTLAVNESLLEAGFELKDATPSNILFRGCEPIFIDHTSPSARKVGAMGWKAYGQFSRTFVIPLLVHRLRGLSPSDIFLTHRDGLPLELAAKLLGKSKFTNRVALAHVGIPSWLGRNASASDTPAIRTASYGDNVTRSLLRRLAKTIRKACPERPPHSAWSSYQSDPGSYRPGDVRAKDDLVRCALARLRPRTVLDLGTNTGRHALMAAQVGATVVAVDSDGASIERLFSTARHQGADILPLVVDIGRPSPAAGWNNTEQSSFLQRTEGRFELVMMLALMHHLLVTERIPVPELAAYAAKLTTRHALIEWVDPTDDHFRRIAGPNAPLYANIDAQTFESALQPYFEIIERTPLKAGQRHMFLLKKRTQP